MKKKYNIDIEKYHNQDYDINNIYNGWKKNVGSNKLSNIVDDGFLKKTHIQINTNDNSIIKELNSYNYDYKKIKDYPLFESDEDKLEKMDIKAIEKFLRKKKIQNLKDKEKD